MKLVQLNFLLFLFVTAITAVEPSKENGVRSKVRPGNAWASDSAKLSDRLKRQTETATTPKPKKPRPSNLFGLISTLLTETRDDANRAFNEIGTLFNNQFANSTQAPPMGRTTEDTPSSTSDNDEDNEITTTTEQFRITRDEFFGVLRSNVQGLVNLFGKEFRVAIRDSNQNVREFGRDLGVALRPYFYNTVGSNNNSTSKTNSRRSN